MDPASFIKAELVLLGMREERSNGINGILGVMFVVRSRVDASKAGHPDWKRFDGDWLKVMTAHGQFSSMSIAGDPMDIWYPDIRDPLFQKVIAAVDGIYDGTYQDKLTDGALYYADLGSPGFDKNGWFSRTILANEARFPRVATVGSTAYFADKG